MIFEQKPEGSEESRNVASCGRASVKALRKEWLGV